MIILPLLKAMKIKSKKNYTQLKGKCQVFCNNRENACANPFYMSALQSLHVLCQISVREAVESYPYTHTAGPKITRE